MNKIKTNNISVKTIFRTAFTEYIKILTDPRFIIVGMLLLVTKNLVIDPLVQRSVKYGEPLNIAEPFIAVCNCPALLMFIPGVFIILIADFPDISGHTLFMIKRSGKINWLLGQLSAVLLYILTYMAVIFIGCCVFVYKNSYWGLNWSDVVTKYGSRFPNEKNGFEAQLLPSNLYNQMNFFSAFLHTVLLLILYMFLIALILMMFRVLNLKIAGVFSAFAVVAAGLLTVTTGSEIRWAFPSAHAITWKHFTEVMRQPIVSMKTSYIYFAVLILAFLILDIFLIKNINVNTSGE